MINFQELNNKLPEYHLIPLIINFSGKQNYLYDKYEYLYDKYKSFHNTDLYKNEKLSIEFIKEFKEYIKDYYVIDYLKELGFNTIEFIREFFNHNDYNNWLKISRNLKKDGFDNIEFVKEFQDKLIWRELSRLYNYNFNNIEFIRQFQNKIYFGTVGFILKDIGLDDIEFIREFKHKFINNMGLSENLKIYGFYNIDFIREFKDILDWYIISENFVYHFCINNIEIIKEFNNYIHWNKVKKDVFIKYLKYIPRKFIIMYNIDNKK